MHAAHMSKMKVDPAMLMKTNKSWFQVSGARRQELGARVFLSSAGRLVQGTVQDEGSSGYVDENKYVDKLSIKSAAHDQGVSGALIPHVLS